MIGPHRAPTVEGEKPIFGVKVERKLSWKG